MYSPEIVHERIPAQAHVSVRAAPPARTAEAQLAGVAMRLAGAQYGSMIAAHFGWVGDRPKSLREIAESRGLSAERVRQVREHVLHELRQRHYPRLEAVAMTIDALRPCGAASLERCLRESGLVGPRFDAGAIVSTLVALGLRPELSVGRIGGRLHVGSNVELKQLRALARVSRKLFANWGVLAVDDIHRRVGRSIAVSKIIAFFAEQRGSRVSGDGRWIAGTGESWAELRLKKVFALTDRIALDEFHDLLRRAPKLGTPPSIEAMGFAAAGWTGYRVAGGVIERLKAFDEADVLSPVELTLLKVMRAGPSVWPIVRLQDACFAAGMNPKTLRAYLSWSPIVRRVGQGLYALVSASPGPAAPPPGACRRGGALIGAEVQTDCVQITFRLTLGSATNGVIGLPAAARSLAGEFACRDERGTQIGTCRVSRTSISGLRRPLLATEALTGDLLTLEFLPGERSVVLHRTAEAKP